MFHYIFNQSLQLPHAPSVWIKLWLSLNDFRPVALTALILMKIFEKLAQSEILQSTEYVLDPLQFAYRLYRGVEDAIPTLLNLLLKH